MAEPVLNDQQQQPQQLPQYGVDFGLRPKARALPYVKAVPHVPVPVGVPNIRAKPLPAPSVREHQQQQVMLQEDYCDLFVVIMAEHMLNDQQQEQRQRPQQLPQSWAHAVRTSDAKTLKEWERWLHMKPRRMSDTNLVAPCG